MSEHSNRWSRNTIRWLVRNLDGAVTGRRLAEWAREALDGGFDSPATRRLAGLMTESDPSRADAAPLFEEALRELGLSSPNEQEARLRFVDELAREIVSGTAKIAEALDEIHLFAVGPLGHPSNLWKWCNLWERRHADCVEPASHEEVRSYAQQWLTDRAPKR